MITVDRSKLDRLFNTLTGRQLNTVLRKATRESALKLTKEARLLFKSIVGNKVANSKNWWNGKTLVSGIKYSWDKKVSHKVHIMGDFRLKFFEQGTNERYTKKGYYRGRMVKKRFFDPTILRLETRLSRDILDSIKKNLIKYALNR